MSDSADENSHPQTLIPVVKTLGCVFISLQEILGQSEGRLLPLRSQNPLWQLLVCVRRCHSDSWAKEAVQLLWHSEPGTATVLMVFCFDIFMFKI